MTRQDRLTQWMAKSAAVRARMLAGGGKPGLAQPDSIAEKTGMDVMQAMLASELPYPHIAETLDFALIAVEPGKAVFQGAPPLKHYNPLGTVHGGCYAVLLDSAVGCGEHTMMLVSRGYATAALSVNIVRSASYATEPLRAMARSSTAANNWPRPKAASSGRTASFMRIPPPAWCSGCRRRATPRWPDSATATA